MVDVHLKTGRAEIVVDARRGGRLASLQVDGHQLLLIGHKADEMQWGSYPMVPWAGRIRNGRFQFGGRDVQLPQNLPPHAIHGVGYVSPWTVTDEQTISCALEEPWPFGGSATQRFDLDEDGLTITMAVTAAVDMPVMMGWHPWFSRFLIDAAGNAVEAELTFGAAKMYALDEVAIPTGDLVTPREGPWDNCFVDLERDPKITWPGLLSLSLSSSCDHWVIYTEPRTALCVEPQTAAPDLFNRPDCSESIVSAGDQVTAWFRIGWG